MYVLFPLTEEMLGYSHVPRGTYFVVQLLVSGSN